MCQTYALDKSLLGQKSTWTNVPWTKVPWTTVSLDNRPLDNCCNTAWTYNMTLGLDIPNSNSGF